MNRKTTNRIVAIFNIISIASFYLFSSSASYLMSSVMSGENGGKLIYNSFIIETLLNNIQIILPLLYCGIGTINIICAIQNKDNKKICFWQLVFGGYYLWTGLGILILLTNIDETVVEWIEMIIFSIIPIILAIINLILIKRHKPRVIQIISYIAVIILSILSLLKIINIYWQIIAVVMQLLYIHFQDKNIQESTPRKVVNIILYYVLQLILSVGFFVLVLSSLLITKVNEVQWENGLNELYNNITTLNGSKNKELYIPVEKNYKYGFIDENGKEKISCQYDRVTYFNEIEINNSTYYIALAKKDNKFYIISKSNNSIELNSALERYMQTIYSNFGESMTSTLNKKGNYRLAYLQSFEFLLKVFTKNEVSLNHQTVEKLDTNFINLTEKDSKYYYKSKNYSMMIEPYNNVDYDDDYFDENENYYVEDYYDEAENNYYLSSTNTKYNVTITKSNGEQTFSTVYLPGLNEYDATLDIFTNGYIQFENEEQTCYGWYDSDGNQMTIPNIYTIKDIKDNKVILQLNNTEDDNYDKLYYFIIDLTGNTLLQTTAIDIYDNMYLVKNDNNKMVLIDNDLNVISNEYDRILTTTQMDISSNYCSYIDE